MRDAFGLQYFDKASTGRISATSGTTIAGWWRSDELSGPAIYCSPCENDADIGKTCGLRVELAWFAKNSALWRHTVRSPQLRNDILSAVQDLRRLGDDLTVDNLEDTSVSFRTSVAKICRLMLLSVSEIQQQGVRVRDVASFAVKCENKFASLFTNHGQTGQSVLCSLLRLCRMHYLYDMAAEPHSCVGRVDAPEGSLLHLASLTAEPSIDPLVRQHRWPPKPTVARAICIKLHRLCRRIHTAVLTPEDATRTSMSVLLNAIARHSNANERACLLKCPFVDEATAHRWAVKSVLLWRGRHLTSDEDLRHAVTQLIHAKQRIVVQHRSNKRSEDYDPPDQIQFTHLCWNPKCPNLHNAYPCGVAELPSRSAVAAHSRDRDCFLCKRGVDPNLGEIIDIEKILTAKRSPRRSIAVHKLCAMSLPEYGGTATFRTVLSNACTRGQFSKPCPLCGRPGTTLQCCGKRCKKKYSSYHFACAWKAGCGFTAHLSWGIYCPDCLRVDERAHERLAFPARHSLLEWVGFWTAPMY